ncbi:UV radiation resistance-associated protein-like protein [Corchorus olitorius]|uniref:UV radiation resistance-associated protein-like protein n=1 Tax=Corchorus olitorius TaxID=93759 RepID=A0A1R3KK58_9ROSI|nr:UV radiation resistance-associated protein-like protein [Corchorus olitorius]
MKRLRHRAAAARAILAANGYKKFQRGSPWHLVLGSKLDFLKIPLLPRKSRPIRAKIFISDLGIQPYDRLGT